VTIAFVILKILHIVSVVMAFGPLFVYPFMVKSSTADPTVIRAGVIRAMRAARSTISEPAFLAVGPLGVLAATQHPDEQVFLRLWVQLAIPLWMFAVSVVWFVQRPLAKKVFESAVAIEGGDDSRGTELNRRITWLTRVTWVSWAGLFGMVLLMTTRPS
jgi:uncharacterized membrane protein